MTINLNLHTDTEEQIMLSTHFQVSQYCGNMYVTKLFLNQESSRFTASQIARFSILTFNGISLR